MSDWIEDLAMFLEEAGHGTRGVSLFKGRMPDNALVEEPTLALMVNPGNVYFTAGAGVAVRQPMVELSSRAKTYSAAWLAIESAWLELHTIKDQLIGETHFMTVKGQGDIEDEDRDEDDRQLFVARLEVWM